MLLNKVGVGFGFVAGVFVAQMAFAQVSSTTSESLSTTSGSSKRLFVKNESERLHLFVDQNFDRLEEAAARGSGSILNDYVSLIGCENHNNVMGKAIQKNYTQLFNSGKDQLLKQTTQMIDGDIELIQACETRS